MLFVILNNLWFRRTILAEDLKTIFNFEEQWMFDFLIDRGAISNKKNYDDAFLLSSPQLHVKKFQITWIPNNVFTVKREENIALSFLDIKFFRDVGKLHTLFYRRPIFTGILTNFEFFYKCHTTIMLFLPCCIAVSWFIFLIEL